MADSEANATASDGRDIGPTMAEFLCTCWDTQPVKLLVAVGAAGIAWLVTCALFLSYRCTLLRAPLGLRRLYYLRIAFCPVVLGGAALVAIVSPTSFNLCSLVQKCYEAVTLATFGSLLFALLWRESGAGNGSVEAGLKAVVAALALQGPKKHYAVPPIGCCLRPCLSTHDLTVRDLRFVHSLVQQYVVLMPLCGVLGVFLLSAFRLDTLVRYMGVLKSIRVVSSLLCLYGLFIMYVSTHDLLHRWNTTKKFVAIKVVLIVMAYQENMLDRHAPGFLEHMGNSCFSRVHFAYRHWSEVEAGYWAMWLLALEMVPMILALRFAFPAEELKEVMPEIHRELLEMAMDGSIQQEKSFRESSKGSESESESNSESDGESL